ncbi:MAG: DNA/RNA nuclease SfsA [Leptolyngbyaceae bacterium]|nr:DNA/RNA nuclease SfsA [Leptolyngbyaceae bacterium]
MTQPSPPNPWTYPYPPLQLGRLIKRYKRFMADIQLESGETITAHCPNTGPMTGVCTVGSRVMVSRSDNPKRKLAYTWELIEVQDNGPTWVGVNTALPNQVMKSALLAHLIPELGTYDNVRAEVPYGKDRKSRIDFLLTSQNPAPDRPAAPIDSPQGVLDLGNLVQSENTPDNPDHRPIYVEVKNTTWARGTTALFPDTVTTRGQKHLHELMAVVLNARAVMVYFINRGDCTHFSPGDEADPTYGQLLREAIAQGVEVLPCRFDITPDGIRYLGLAKLAF